MLKVCGTKIKATQRHNIVFPFETTTIMVLEDATADRTGTFTDASSPSDFDPYDPTSLPTSSSGAPADLSFLDYTRLPAPIPILGPFYGFTREKLRSNISGSVTQVSQQARRPLTRPETEAIAYHMAKMHAIASYGSPVGSLAGIWRAYNSRAEFRWPFYKPDLDKVDLAKFGPLRGEAALTGRHVGRYAAYFLMGGFFGRYVVGFYAATVAATGTGLDPRMKEVVDLVAGNRRQEAGRRAASRGEAGPGPGPGPMSSPSPVARGQGSPRQAATNAVGMQGTEGMGTREGSYAPERYRAFGESGPQPTGQAPSPYSPASPYPTASSESSSLPFDFDDASPTAGNEPMQGGPELSAWDRIRKGQTPTPPQARGDRASEGAAGTRNVWESARRGDALQREQREGSTVGDAYAFSRGDEERKKEREKEQREFDQRLERERQGGDFEGGGGRWK